MAAGLLGVAAVSDNPPMIAPPRRRGASEGGFTLTEMMVVVVIIGILAAVSTPLMTREKRESDGDAFANEVAQQLQKSRIAALSERLPVTAFVYSDRIELRSWIAPPPASPGGPIRANVTHPILRLIPAADGVEILDAVIPGAAQPTGPVVNRTGTYREIIIQPNGSSIRTEGGAVLPANPNGVNLYIRNTRVPSTHLRHLQRIDVTALTSFVTLRDKW